jgi:hypothetical protein
MASFRVLLIRLPLAPEALLPALLPLVAAEGVPVAAVVEEGVFTGEFFASMLVLPALAVVFTAFVGGLTVAVFADDAV